jgi:type I restriction enzyme, S subunit
MNNLDSYKNTNIEWVGKIPHEWDLIRGKYLFSSIKEINKNLQCKNLLSLTYDGVLNKDYESNKGLRPENYNTYQIFKKNDLVFKMIDLENVNTSRVGIVHEDGIMSSAYIRHAPIKEKIDSKFAYWFYYDLYKKEIYNSIGSGVRSTLSSSDLLEIRLPIPSLKEQKLISRYLSKKTTKVDLLIEKIKKKVKLLNEHRTLLIGQSLTKGLDPNADMKDSGIELIGKIPKHWKFTKLKYESDLIVDGTHFTPNYTFSGVPFLRVTDITSNQISFDKVKFISEQEHQQLIKRCKPQFGDLLLSKNGTIGKTKIVEWDWKFSIFVSLCLIRLKKSYSTKLLSLFFKSSLFEQQIKDSSKKSTVANLHLDKIREFLLIKPPIEEQDRIVDQVYNLIKPITQLIDLENKRIKTLIEYRQSLISSVVTGKIRITDNIT